MSGSEQTDLVLTCIDRNFAFVHEVHANKCVYLQVINERNGVGNMCAGDYDRERIRPCRTEGKSVCPAETGLLGNLGGMGKRPEDMGFEYTVD